MNRTPNRACSLACRASPGGGFAGPNPDRASRAADTMRIGWLRFLAPGTERPGTAGSPETPLATAR